ncbi:MAG: NADH-quinone oxidoreductase subunit L [Spirosomataceae bacterium]
MVTYHAILYSLLFYLAGACVLYFVRNKWDESLIGLVSSFISIIGLLFTLDVIYRYKDPIYSSWNWFHIGKFDFSIKLIINPLTLLLLFLVQCIGTLVQLYSIRYMSGDKSYGRYFAYLNLFLFAMIGIVISGNLFQLFFFWELVSVSSYLLIGFWYERKKATNASLKAFLVNRIGDVGFLFGLFLVLHTTKSTSLPAVEAFAQTGSPTVTWMGVLFLVGVLGKSAQFPLQVWLPDAMEGPTPASALIHAATMVVAGLFVLARLDYLITPLNQHAFIGIGLFTALLGAISATAQFDIKKVLAYSTISQLGLMLVGIGVGATSASLLHLTTHAFFKAGLFLTAGSIIHLFHHQDMRRMGGAMHSHPYLFFSFGICSAALAGFPLLSGFISKDTLLLATLHWAEKQPSPYAWAVPFLFLIVSATTAFYVSRQVYLIFLNRKDSSLRSDLKYLFRTLFLRVKEQIDILVAANDEEIETPENPKLSTRIRHITLKEVAIGILVLFSFFFIFSINPLDGENSWFFEIFPLTLPHYTPLPYIAASLTLLSTLWGYEWTKSRYGKNRPYPEPPTFWQQLRFHHFFLDYLYCKVIHFLVVHLPSNVDQEDTKQVAHSLTGLSYISKMTDEKGIEYLIKKVVAGCLSLSNYLSKLEYYLVDGTIRGIYKGIGWIGKRTRQIQGGAVQLYIGAMFLFILILIFILFISL